MRGILPAVNRYTADLTQAILRKRELVVPCRVEEDLLSKLSGLTASLYDTMAAMEQAMAIGPRRRGRHRGRPVLPGGDRPPHGGGRQSIDRLESLTAAEYWPIPPTPTSCSLCKINQPAPGASHSGGPVFLPGSL